MRMGGMRREVKYLAAVAGAAPRDPIGTGCMFQNTTQWQYHLFFLHSFPATAEMTFDEYIEAVLRRPNRAWWGGEVVYSPTRMHPITGTPGVLIFALYTEDTAGNQLTADDVRAVHARMRECIPFAADRLAFTPQSNEQLATAQRIQAELAAEGIAVLLP
jgi:hypothetical protein